MSNWHHTIGKMFSVIFVLLVISIVSTPVFAERQCGDPEYELRLDIYECILLWGNTCDSRILSSGDTVACTYNAGNGECKTTYAWCSNESQCVLVEEPTNRKRCWIGNDPGCVLPGEIWACNYDCPYQSSNCWCYTDIDISCDCETDNFDCWVEVDDPPSPTGEPGPTSTPTSTVTPSPSSSPSPSPTPMSDISVKVVNEDSTDCNTIRDSTAKVGSGTVHLTGGPPPPSPSEKDLSPSDNPVTWAGLPGGDTTYISVVEPPINTIATGECLYDVTDNFLMSSNDGLSMSINTSGRDNHNFGLYVAVKGPGPWRQTGGGDVFASGQITSLVPAPPPSLYFSEVGIGGFPGLVSYGSGLDASLPVDKFGTEPNGSLSTMRWNTDVTPPPYTGQSFYDHFTLLLGGMVAPGDSWDNVGGNLTQAAITACGVSTPFCYFTGNDATINEAITIGADQKKIIVIERALTINNTITIEPGGFLTFIVKNDIEIDPTVGAAPVSYDNAASPHIQGIYITDGRFSVPSGATPDKQLVSKGMFIADNFSISRSLTKEDNTSYSSTIFIYDPSLLFTMPLIMQEAPFRWQEVAP